MLSGAPRRDVHPFKAQALSQVEQISRKIRISRQTTLHDDQRGTGHLRRDLRLDGEEKYPAAMTEETGTGTDDGEGDANGDARGDAQEATYAASHAENLAGVKASSATHAAYGVYPFVSSFLMSTGLILIGVACYFSGGDLFAADNKAICLLMMGAALEMMSLLLVSPVAAFLLAITIIGFVAMAFLHRQTRAACCPGPATEGQEILDDELQEESEMFCML